MPRKRCPRVWGAVFICVTGRVTRWPSGEPGPQATKAHLDQAQKLHVAVFFVTGRHKFERAWTSANLESAGYSGFAGLYMEPNDQTCVSAADFKIGARKAIQNLGYHIIFCVGDQMTISQADFPTLSCNIPIRFTSWPSRRYDGGHVGCR